MIRAAEPGGATPGRAVPNLGRTPYDVPLAIDDNPAPHIFETTLVAADTRAVNIGNGVTANVMTFNGTVPGPEIDVNVHDTVIVHFVNNTHESTGIHWHGIEVDNASDGTPLTQNMVPPGHSFLYKFVAPSAGVFWYHPHHHSSPNQVFKGLYGAVIVHDPAEATLQAKGVLPPAADTRTVMLGDMTVCKAPGHNDATTYNSSQPWVGGGVLPAQPAPHPTDLCDKPIDDNGNPVENPPGHPVPLKAGDVPNIQRTAGPSNEGQTVLTNGINAGGRAGNPSAPGALVGGAQTLQVVPGQGQRLQFVNTATVRYFRLQLTDSQGKQINLVRVGGEGGLLDAAVVEGGTPGGFDFLYGAGEILLGPGQRADVVAAIPASAKGVATLWTEDFPRLFGSRFTDTPTVPVAHFDITGTPASPPYAISAGTPILKSVGRSTETLPAPTGGFITPAGGFTPGGPKDGMASQDIQLGPNGNFINGVKGVHDFPGDYTAVPKVGSTRYAAHIGDTLELTATNATGLHHPFHPHGFSIQPLDFEQPGLPAAGAVVYTFARQFVDTVDIPGNTTLRYRVRLDDRPLMDGVTMGGGFGRWVMHCHIFFHAVFGMISEIIVTDPSGNERPNVNADDVATAPVNEGDTAHMHGTFHDLEGDAVTLTASRGTVTQGPGNTWDWSYPTTGAPGENGLVYITATEARTSSHLKDQAAFELKVSDPQGTAAGMAFSTVEGRSSQVSVATFTDPNRAATASDYTATINWGDGTSSPGIVGGPTGGPFTVSGGHAYAREGVATATVTVADADAAGHTATVTSRATIVDAALTSATPATTNATNPVNAVVARFVDADPAGVASDYGATINWGDGSAVSRGVVSGPLGGRFSVSGTHTYPAGNPFSYTVSVHVCDGGGSCVNTSTTLLLLHMTGDAYASRLTTPTEVKTFAEAGPVDTAAASNTASSGSFRRLNWEAGVITSVNPNQSAAQASYGELTVPVPGMPAIMASFAQASSQTTCSGSTGTATINSLTINGSVVASGNYPPNTTTSYPTGASPMTVVINEQIPVPGGLRVNAMHITGPGGFDMVIASATSDIHNCP